MATAATGTTCSLRSCKGKIDGDTGRVEVRAYQVSPEHRRSLKAHWNDNGEGIFHPKCWSILKNAVSESKASELDLGEIEENLVKEANKHAEYHDPDPLIETEAARIAKMLKDAEHCIAFTGAGISTAAGIGDFRGKDGKWTEREKLKEHGSRGAKKSGNRGYSIVELRPTYTHEAILKLLELGLLKFIISQNTDGLHSLSGIPASKISELHGNAFVEKCEKCETRYERTSSYRALPREKVPPNKCKRCRIDHRTGRICENKACGGYCMNTIINFGDYLETSVLDQATKNARKADLVLCLGSTLMVSPANDLVKMGKVNPIRLIICNRQGTPYDNHCTIKGSDGDPAGCRIYGDCDKLMKQVMRVILGEEKLKQWEDGRPDRMSEYDKRR